MNPAGYYAFVKASYDVWSFVFDPASIQYDATRRTGSAVYGRPVVPDASSGLLRLCEEGEEPFGYLGRIHMDGWAECVARKPVPVPN